MRLNVNPRPTTARPAPPPMPPDKKPFLVTMKVDERTLYCLRRGASALEVFTAEKEKGVNVMRVSTL